MVNWRDPATQAAEGVAYIKLEHVLIGAYIWEIVVSISFDIHLLRTIFQRSDGHTTPSVKIMYLACRYLGLAWAVIFMSGLNVQSVTYCPIWNKLQLFCTTASIWSASALIGIRTIAVWQKKMVIRLVTIGVLTCQFAASFYSMMTVRGAWVDSLGSCEIVNSNVAVPTVSTMFASDLILISLMLFGLHRQRVASRYNLWHYLWNQGLLWLVLSVFAEIPTIVFMSLNLNPIMDLMTMTAELMILVIGATRMYRTLSGYYKAHKNTGRIYFSRTTAVLSIPDHTPDGSSTFAMAPVRSTMQDTDESTRDSSQKHKSAW